MVNNSPSFLRRIFKKSDNTNFDNKIPIIDEEEQSRLLQYFVSFASDQPNLNFVFSLDGEIISQNHNNINKLLGYNPKDKADLKSLVPESIQKVLESAFNDAMKGKTSRHEINIPDRIGNDIYLLLTFIPIKVRNNPVEGVYLVVDNITEQIAMKETLELQREHFERAQEVANIASWEYIIDEDSLLLSKKCFQLFGLGDSKNLSMDKPFELIHPDDYENTKKIVSESMYKGKNYHTVFRIYHGKTNELKYIRVKADAVWKNKKPYKLVGIVHDITIQKKLEKKLKNTIKEFEHIYQLEVPVTSRILSKIEGVLGCQAPRFKESKTDN